MSRVVHFIQDAESVVIVDAASLKKIYGPLSYDAAIEMCVKHGFEIKEQKTHIGCGTIAPKTPEFKGGM